MVILANGSTFNKLLHLLRNTDWATTPVYYQFQRNNRWKHEDSAIYSEVEVKYNISYLNKILTKGYGAEETQDTISYYIITAIKGCESR